MSLKLSIDDNSKATISQQLADKIHFAIISGDLKPGEQLPSLRGISAELKIATNTVVKAFKLLEQQGLIRAANRQGYVVSGKSAEATSDRYGARGVSTSKSEIHAVVDNMDAGVFPGAFCKIIEDYLTGDPQRCTVIHSDGSGTKSLLAYLHYRETGDVSPFYGIAQDSIVMNLDDLICVGACEGIVISNTVNRNAVNCPGEVIEALIQGSEDFLQTLRDYGVNIYSGGGETADVGDLTGAVVVDTCAVASLYKRDVIANDRIEPGLVILGLSSTGQAVYETRENSGISSNGLTSARHELLHKYYGEKYPETFAKNVNPVLMYAGPWRLDDPLPGSVLTVGDALLSPTRTYSPLLVRILRENRAGVRGLIHCSGGAQVKCLRFGRGVHYVKDNLFPIPPLFMEIQRASGTSQAEMYRVFNMGHRLEIICAETDALWMTKLATEMGIDAQIIGHVEATTDPGGRNQVSIMAGGETLIW